MNRPAAIYARVSSDRQKENQTIASQTAALKEYAESHGYLVPAEWVFEDDGCSGASLIRPGLEAMRDLAAQGQIEAALVYAPDRLSRKYAYQVLLGEEFARCGVSLVFLKAPSEETAEDQLLVQFQGMIAEYERAQIVERTRRGKRHKAQQGLVNVLGGAPYGYRYIKKSDNANGDGALGAINGVGHLAESGVPGQSMLRQDRIGPRQRITRPLRQRNRPPNRNSANHERPRQEWIEIPVPALISENTFDLAQEQLQKNKQHSPRRTIEPTLLQGMLVCQHCGYALYRSSTKTTKRKLYYYRCLGSDAYRHLKGSVCSNRPIRQNYLDEFVWKEIIHLLDEPALIQSEIDRRMQAARNADPLRKREQALRHQQTRLKNHMDRMVTAYQEELITLAELRQRMPNLRKQEQVVDSELRSLELASEDQSRYLRLAETLSEFRGKLRVRAETLDTVERQKILRLVVQEILGGSDTIRIRHSIPVADSGPRQRDGLAPAMNPAGGGGSPGYLLRTGRHLTIAGQHLPPLCRGPLVRAEDETAVSESGRTGPLRGRSLHVLRECGGCRRHEDSAAGASGAVWADACRGEDHTTDLGPRTNDGTHKRRRLTFLGFTIYRARSLGQSVRKTVFQTEGKRFSRAKAGMKDLRRRMKHHPVEEPAGAINRILRGHFNYYGLAGNARKLQSFWNFTQREWKHTLSKRSQKGRLTWEALKYLLEKNPLVPPRIRISYPQLPANSRL